MNAPILEREVDPRIAAKGYTFPEALVSTEWLARHRGDPSIRLIESNEDAHLYETGHIERAQRIDWHIDLEEAIARDHVDRSCFQALVRRLGIDPSHSIIFYGDANNWWATYAFWVFKLYGFQRAAILDGGRSKWEREGHPLVTDVPSFPPTSYVPPVRRDTIIRAFQDEALLNSYGGTPILDVRSADEYSGRATHMAGYPDGGVRRAGHIPGAKNVAWDRAANSDGSFKSALELRTIYEKDAGLTPADQIITYCRLGERSSHTWFVLSYLLGYPSVRNYDASWTEWGNSDHVPIEQAISASHL